jgi:organic radical activating enzyme
MSDQKFKPVRQIPILDYKKQVLDTKSASFCGAKWYHASMWLNAGWTTSCFHNPTHQIDPEAIKINPKALHNTAQKKQERLMMQKGEKPIGCQFCWVMEDLDPDNVSDRVWQSYQFDEYLLNKAFENSHEDDYDLGYLEIAFDRTCQMACTYCNAAISSTWAKDIRKNGAYQGLVTDNRGHYLGTADQLQLFVYPEENAYTEAFFKWWDSDLHRTLQQLRITGGEPMMSGWTWKLLDWLKNNPNKSKTRIEMTTNLAYSHDTLLRFLDSISGLTQPVWIYTSGECVGEKAEYIRDGHDWDLWQKNIETVYESKLIENVSVMATMSAPATDGFMDWLHFLLEQKKQRGSKWMMMSVNPVRFPTLHSVAVLPMSMRLDYSQQILEFMSRDDVQNNFIPWEKENINRFAVYLEKMDVPHREYEYDVAQLPGDFKRFYSQYDQRRGKDFVKTFPRLKSWYESLLG